VIVAIPANFLFNKLWTFRSHGHGGHGGHGKGEVRVTHVG
jgi:putative flippase GtrA